MTSLVQDLVARAARGDRAAFENLAGTRIDGAFRTALAILGHEADARDAVQETFLKAWRELPGLRDRGRFDAWLGRILVNTCRSSLKGRRRAQVREVPVDGFDQLGSRPARASGPAFDDRTATLDLIERAFDRLSVADRTLLVMHHGEHRQVGEIARILGIPNGTAKSRLHAARRSLGRALEVESR